ncbi:MAG: 50S ribosomal protein L14 [bacterium]|jgi:large subunit ribosomal protein L14
MLPRMTKLVVADNSGAKVVQLIGMYNNWYRKYAYIGDIVKVSVKDAIPHSNVEKGDVVTAVIVRMKRKYRRDDGSYVRFDDNAVVLIDEQGNPKGTRIFGPIPRELRDKGFTKILSLATEVV